MPGTNMYVLTENDDVSGKDGNTMNIIKDLIPEGRRNRPGRSNPMKYVTIHNTGNTSKGANAKAHANYVKGDSAANTLVSWHYSVDEMNIYQHIPDNEDAFHAGDGSGNGNRQSIGIEICMNSDGDLLGATDHAVKLTAQLCKDHNISIGNVVQHNRWTGKNCPQMIRAKKPYDWDTFISKVKQEMGGALATPAPVFKTYMVRVTASELNIRKGPGTNYGNNGSIKDKGVYTIVEEANGVGAKKWCKLKSGAGWISYDYVKRV